MNSISVPSAKSTSANPPTVARRCWKVELMVLAFIISVGFLSRFLLDDIPNFKPIAALALFGGFFFHRKWMAVMGLVAILMASDLLLGGYPLLIAASVYGSLALGCLLGQTIGARDWNSRLGRYVGVSAAALFLACVFFVLTNLAVWTLWYTPTLEGLSVCFINAIPFFKYTVAGNLLFSVGAFGVYDVVALYFASQQNLSITDGGATTAQASS